MSLAIERMLQRKLLLDISDARMVVSEARENLKVGQDILWSRILVNECLKITEFKRLIKDGIPVAPTKYTEFGLHSLVENKQRTQAQSLTLSPSKEPMQKSSTVYNDKDRATSLPSSRIQDARKSDSSPCCSPVYKSKRRPGNAPRTSTKRDVKSIPQSPLPSVALSTIEENHSLHEATRNRPKKKPPQGKNLRLQQEPEGAALQGFFVNILGNYKKCPLVQDNFKPLLFDYDLRTLASDGESVSSSNSGWTWGSSTKSSSTADMGVVRQLAARFEEGRAQQGRAPMKPKRQKSFDSDDDSLGPPIETVLMMKRSPRCRTNR